MTPREFWSQCRQHDWFYTYSDDPGVYRLARDNEDRLVSIAGKDPALADIYKAWHAHYYESGPRPPEPKLEEA